MNWKLKAIIQNTVSLFPSSTSYAVYYWIQRNFGGLRRICPVSGLSAGIETWKRIKDQDYGPSEKVFFEVGTGRVPLVPLAYWLMGAKKSITIDVNPYLKRELIRECLQYISNNKTEIYSLFGSLMDKNRFNDLLTFNGNANFSTKTFLDLCKIDYIAPGNATKIDLPNQSIDFYTSYNVFEHIPLEVLKQIIEEGNRIISENGLFINRIDYSDHFSHSDKRISAINFLQYSDDKFDQYSGNRYMYMNRLRHDDFINLFQSIGHQVIVEQADIDIRSQELLKRGTQKIDERFSAKSKETLSITGAWIVSKKFTSQ